MDEDQHCRHHHDTHDRRAALALQAPRPPSRRSFTPGSGMVRSTIRSCPPHSAIRFGQPADTFGQVLRLINNSQAVSTTFFAGRRGDRLAPDRKRYRLIDRLFLGGFLCVSRPYWPGLMAASFAPTAAYVQDGEDRGKGFYVGLSKRDRCGPGYRCPLLRRRRYPGGSGAIRQCGRAAPHQERRRVQGRARL